MRSLVVLVVLAGAAACSPTTDVTRTSTERTAGRTGYQVLNTQPEGTNLRVQLRVDSLAAARTVAEDVVVKKREPFQRVEVDVFGPGDNVKGRPAGILRWSQTGGFTYSDAKGTE